MDSSHLALLKEVIHKIHRKSKKYPDENLDKLCIIFVNIISPPYTENRLKTHTSIPSIY
jgi:hypothetical protein